MFVAVLVPQHSEFHGTVMPDMVDFPVNRIIPWIESTYFPGCGHGILINSGALAALHVSIRLGPVKKQIPAPVRKSSEGKPLKDLFHIALCPAAQRLLFMLMGSVLPVRRAVIQSQCSTQEKAASRTFLSSLRT